MSLWNSLTALANKVVAEVSSEGNLSQKFENITTLIKEKIEEETVAFKEDDENPKAATWLDTTGTGPVWERVPAAWSEGREKEWELLCKALPSDDNTFTVGPDRPEAMLSEMRDKLRNKGVDLDTDVSGLDINVLLPTALLTVEAQPSLGEARFKLVPGWVKEQRFWFNYFWKIRELGKCTSVEQCRALLGLLNLPPPPSTTATSTTGGSDKVDSAVVDGSISVGQADTGSGEVTTADATTSVAVTQRKPRKAVPRTLAQQAEHVTLILRLVAVEEERRLWMEEKVAEIKEEVKSAKENIHLLNQVLTSAPNGDSDLQSPCSPHATSSTDFDTAAAPVASTNPELLESLYESCKYHKQKVNSMMSQLQGVGGVSVADVSLSSPVSPTTSTDCGTSLMSMLLHVNSQLQDALRAYEVMHGGGADSSTSPDWLQSQRKELGLASSHVVSSSSTSDSNSAPAGSGGLPQDLEYVTSTLPWEDDDDGDDGP